MIPQSMAPAWCSGMSTTTVTVQVVASSMSSAVVTSKKLAVLQVCYCLFQSGHVSITAARLKFSTKIKDKKP